MTDTSYTTTLLPLTEADKQVIKKAIKPYYQVNFILIPVLAVVFFFGLWYFLIFLTLVVCYNLFAFSSIKKNELSLSNPKTILTGEITKKEPPGDGTFIYFGQERFELTYANITYPVEVGDKVSLHYSQFNANQRGILLSVEKQHIR
ncbi:hypothetical protein AAHN97_15995 [Chitinophaga niabensis]|uniref:hypothetical protein n=1 Tax=Chitinophaga niabensis TaxID=536979 RepID=UPI0031BA0C01